jgi:signal transduction histidine kinase
MIQSRAAEMDVCYTLGNLEGILQRSREGLKRIQQIVLDLRGFARSSEFGDLQQGVDMNAAIESTLNIVRGQAKRRNVEVESQLAPLPPIACYPAKMNQVVLNLVANAIDACCEGGKVIVRTTTLPDGVEIHVIDNGCGIDPAVREKIFDPFFSTKPQGVGTGLGLSISHGIVNEHGGRISVESTPGRGSQFTVFLPAKAKGCG